jgi:alcohol dehydrogenase class IV
MRANVDALRAESPGHAYLGRYAVVGRTLAGERNLPDEQAIEAGIDFASRLSERLGIPGLGTCGLTPDAIDEMVGLAGKASSMRYNPVVLADQALAEILHKAI